MMKPVHTLNIDAKSVEDAISIITEDFDYSITNIKRRLSVGASPTESSLEKLRVDSIALGSLVGILDRLGK